MHFVVLIWMDTLIITFQTCSEVESTRMICLTPEIDIPPELNHTKRGLPSVDNTGNVDQDSQVVASKEESTNEILEFYLGFIQDGFKGYRDLRDSPLKEKAILKVIDNDPDIHTWDTVKKHKDGNSITIEVGNTETILL